MTIVVVRAERGHRAGDARMRRRSWSSAGVVAAGSCAELAAKQDVREFYLGHGAQERTEAALEAAEDVEMSRDVLLKKEPKNFCPLGRVPGAALGPSGQKFFCFFFKKKTLK
jgi:hypothetical protein